LTFYIWDDEVVTDYYIPEDILGDDSPEHVIGSGHRRWLDFGKAPDEYSPECMGCGNIACLIEYGYAGPVDIDQCVSAKPGVAATFLKNTPPQIVPIPVYEENCEEAAEGCGGDGIVVLDFACIDIIGAVEIHWEGHKHRLIEFKVICDNTTDECLNECARTDGEAPGPGEVTAVSLLE